MADNAPSPSFAGSKVELPKVLKCQSIPLKGTLEYNDAVAIDSEISRLEEEEEQPGAQEAGLPKAPSNPHVQESKLFDEFMNVDRELSKLNQLLIDTFMLPGADDRKKAQWWKDVETSLKLSGQSDPTVVKTRCINDIRSLEAQKKGLTEQRTKHKYAEQMFDPATIRATYQTRVDEQKLTFEREAFVGGMDKGTGELRKLFQKYEDTIARQSVLHDLHRDTLLLLLLSSDEIKEHQNRMEKWEDDAKKLLNLQGTPSPSSLLEECGSTLQRLVKDKKRTQGTIDSLVDKLNNPPIQEQWQKVATAFRDKERLGALFKLHELRLKRNKYLGLIDIKGADGSTGISKKQVVDKVVWALLIGIDKYESSVPLQGAVVDVNAVEEYLRKDLDVPESHIRCLKDGEATRKGIFDVIGEHLLRNAEIQRDHAILIFYAGHGASYATREVWEGTGGSIEAICPVDRGSDKGTVDISDREFHHILLKLHRLKTDNITLIVDCCYAGGTVRSAEDLPDANVRRSHTLRGTLAPMLKLVAENPLLDSQDASAVLRSDWTPNPDAFVILAACQDHQSAWETRTGGGVFTAALLRQLRKSVLRNTTYLWLAQALGPLPSPQDPRQNPIVWGSRASSAVFHLLPPATSV